MADYVEEKRKCFEHFWKLKNLTNGELCNIKTINIYSELQKSSLCDRYFDFEKMRKIAFKNISPEIQTRLSNDILTPKDICILDDKMDDLIDEIVLQEQINREITLANMYKHRQFNYNYISSYIKIKKWDELATTLLIAERCFAGIRWLIKK